MILSVVHTKVTTSSVCGLGAAVLAAASAAAAVPAIREQLDRMGVDVPLVGDFHYNGHTLLHDFPECAQALSKYRINPGNVGKGSPKPISKRSVVRRRKTRMLNMTSRTAMPPVAHRILKSSFKLLISGNQRGKPQ